MEMESEMEIRRETERGGDGDSRGELEIEKKGMSSYVLSTYNDRLRTV